MTEACGKGSGTGPSRLLIIRKKVRECYERKAREFPGALVVRILKAFAAVAEVPSLVRELSSHRLRSVAIKREGSIA